MLLVHSGIVSLSFQGGKKTKDSFTNVSNGHTFWNRMGIYKHIWNRSIVLKEGKESCGNNFRGCSFLCIPRGCLITDLMLSITSNNNYNSCDILVLCNENSVHNARFSYF